jgi:hypothetical protein
VVGRAFLPVGLGKGAVEGTVALVLVHGGSSYFPFYLGTSGTIEIQFYWMRD